MYEIKMKVQEKMAFYAGGQSMMVCDNGDYELVLDLDAEWNAYETVTVLFTLPVYHGTIEVLCTGRRCAVPQIQVPGVLRIGVTAGAELHTSRWMEINVLPSIRTTAEREAAAVPPDLAQQIIERIDKMEEDEGTPFEPGNALELEEDGHLNVITTDKAEFDGKLPATSGCVYDAVKDTGSAIVSSATGDVVKISDAIVRPVQGIRLFGKSTQNGTATPTETIPVVSAGDGGYITVTAGGKTLTVPTPNGLPGVTVSDDGNYTDDSGQEWLCDELDLNRGVYVHRVGVEVVGADAAIEDRTGTKKNVFSFNTTEYRPAKGVRAICNYGYRGTVGAIEQTDDKGPGVSAYFKSGSKSKLCYIYDPSCATLDELRAKLAAVPLVIVYTMAEPVEVPLTEMVDCSVLCTEGETTVYTDCGAGVEVRYAVDTKAYIYGLVGDIGALLDRI